MGAGRQSSLPGRRNPLAREEPLALPWTDAARLMEHCTACGACARACPQRILRIVGGRTVEVEFHSPCTFCGACAEACPEEVFETDRVEPWSARAVVGPSCLEAQGVSCRACEDFCEARALRARPEPGGRARMVVNLEACTGCGGCVAVCPTNAIAILRTARSREAADAA
jgi:ferredoxin-type protein NapF